MTPIDECITVEDSIDIKFDAEALQEEYVAKEVKARVDKILKKNKREIKRLKQWAETCIFKGNKDGYIYAISKLRSIYKQPALTKDEADVMWNSTYNAIKDTIEYLSKQK